MPKGLYRTRADDATRQALIFQLESGADVFLTEEDMRMAKAIAPTLPPQPIRHAGEDQHQRNETKYRPTGDAMDSGLRQNDNHRETSMSRPNNTSQWAVKSRELALAANNLEELRKAIAGFDGLEVKTTATNMVFADGNPNARVMVIGEAPGADEDIQGKPFVGRSGQLLDKILLSAGLSRSAKNSNNYIYISNVLNWRPPGNRTPTPQEMEIARPFIEKHIALINPDIILFAGAVAVQTLLPGAPTLAKARGKWHNYKPLTEGINLQKPISAYALYHPAYLMRSPLQKKKAWHDMLEVIKKLQD